MVITEDMIRVMKTWDPFYRDGLTNVSLWIGDISSKVWGESLIHLQTSTMQLLKFDGWVIPFHALE